MSGSEMLNLGQYSSIVHYTRFDERDVPLNCIFDLEPRRIEARGSASVLGRERTKYYRRPAGCGQLPSLPVIRYADDVHQGPDVHIAEYLSLRDSYINPRSQSQCSIATQTDYRESESQTLPVSPETRIGPYPQYPQTVNTQSDLDYVQRVKSLRETDENVEGYLEEKVLLGVEGEERFFKVEMDTFDFYSFCTFNVPERPISFVFFQSFKKMSSLVSKLLFIFHLFRSFCH